MNTHRQIHILGYYIVATFRDIRVKNKVKKKYYILFKKRVCNVRNKLLKSLREQIIWLIFRKLCEPKSVCTVKVLFGQHLLSV